MSDGSITFDTKIDKSSFTKDLKTLKSELTAAQREFSALEKKYAGVQKKLDANPNNSALQQQAKLMESQLDILGNKLGGLQMEYDNLAPGAEIGAAIDKTVDKLNGLYEAQNRMSALGTSADSSAWERNQYEIEKNTEALRQYLNEYAQINPGVAASLKASLEGTALASNTAAQNYTKAWMALEEYDKRAKMTSNSSTGLAKSIFSLGNMFKMMATRMAMRAVLSGITTGFKNITAQSAAAKATMDSFSSSATYMSNSFAAAVMPLASMIAPVFERITDAIATAMNALARFFALLGGKSTYTKAVRNNNAVGTAVGKVGKEAKKTGEEEKKALASFDEINQLNLQKDQDNDLDSGSGGGGGAGAGLQFVEEAVGELPDLLKKIKDLFTEGFFDGLGENWKERIEGIKEDLKSIGATLKEIFSDPGVEQAMNRLFESFWYNLGVVTGSAVSAGITIGELFIGGIEVALRKGKEFLKLALTDLFNGLADILDITGMFAKAAADIFTVFGSQFAQDIMGYIIGIVSEIFLTVTTLAVNLTGDLMSMIMTPIIQNAGTIKEILLGVLEAVSIALQPVFETVQYICTWILEAYDAYIAPFFEGVTTALTDLIANVLQSIITYVLPAIQQGMQAIADAWTTYLQPAIEYLLETLTPFLEWLVPYLIGFFNEFLVPLASFLVDVLLVAISMVIDFVLKTVANAIQLIGNLITALINIFRGLITFLQTFFMIMWQAILNACQILFEGFKTSIGQLIDGIIEFFKGIINFLVGVFTGDWDKAWEGVRQIFDGFKTLISGIVEGIKTIFKGIITFITTTFNSDWSKAWEGVKSIFKGVFNGIISIAESAINFIIDALNALAFDVPDWVPVIGGSHFGFEIAHVSLPRLATGTVIPPNAGEFAAILGDNNTDTEVVSPLETIKQALLEALEESGRNQTVTIVFDGDLGALARELKPALDEEEKRKGMKLVVV